MDESNERSGDEPRAFTGKGPRNLFIFLIGFTTLLGLGALLAALTMSGG